MYKSKGKPVHQIWSKDGGRLILNAISARYRFQEILRMMRFDNACEKSENMSPDQLQLIGKKYELWNSTLQNACIPCENLTVDEQLLRFEVAVFSSIHLIKSWKVRKKILVDLR